MKREGYFTAREAADYIKLRLGTFYNYVSAGKIPFRKPDGVGGPKRYRKSDLDQFMGQRKYRTGSESN